MTIRNIDKPIDSVVPQSDKQSDKQSANSSKPAVTETISNGTPSADHGTRLQTQFLRSRHSLGSTQVQQQLANHLSLPIPLPLPRIPTPAGLIDFTTLIPVLTSAVTEGLKNFGLSGIKFGIDLVSALGNGAKSIKEAIDGFGDLAGSHLGDLKSSVSSFSTNSLRSLNLVAQNADKLSGSSDPNAQQMGAAAAKYAQDAGSAINSLKQAMQDFNNAGTVTQKQLLAGIQNFAGGMIGMVTGKSEGVQQMRNGEQQILQALADMSKASQVFGDKASQSKQALADAQQQLTSAMQGSGQLSSADRKVANSIMHSATTIANNASSTYSKANSSANSMKQASDELGASLHDSLEGVWGKVAKAAQDLSSSITGVHETTKQFVSDTADFRNTLAAARKGDTNAIAKLAKWGYNKDNMPAPGTLFVDPNFLKGELVNGQVTASKFPTKTPVSGPPALPDLLFGNGKTITLTDGHGNNSTVKNMTEYQKQVAQERADKLGLKGDSGKPVAVDVAFEGGGGQGKRYVPAYSEMYKLGIVPASATGTSVGAITAAMVAAGADPKQFEDIVHDPRIATFLDLHVGGNAGVFKGEEAYKFLDEKLRQLTGITDRPVTFADLKMPLHIVAAKYSDSNPPPGTDLSKWQDRTFVFSQETTPNTPVALAVRASMAIPGVFDPVEMTDPTTGRTIQLTDGGSLDNLPLGYSKNGLPTVALNLNEPNTNSPSAIVNNLPTLPLPKGNLYAPNVLLNALYGGLFIGAGGGLARDYKERNNPPAGNFVLNLPIWDLQNPHLADDGLTFTYNKDFDPRIDDQSRAVTDDFFRNFLGKLNQSGASGTNLKPLPANTSFTREFDYDGSHYTAKYSGQGDSVLVTGDNGQQRTLFVGHNRLENWLIDDAAFGDLSARLREAMGGQLD